MSSKLNKYAELRSLGYELFICALSILSIFNLAVQFLIPQDHNVMAVLDFMNVTVSLIFMGDFLYRLLTAKARMRYFWEGYGWADLLSSLPFPHFKILRLFRLWRVIRLIAEFGGRRLLGEIVVKRAENTLLTIVFLVLCLLEFGSVLVLSVESVAPNANITTGQDALWWVCVTIATVGYGDKYPVTAAGRVVGVLTMIAGVGLFGTLSAYLANAFLSSGKQRRTPQTQQGALLAAIPQPAQALPQQGEYAELMRLIEAQEQTLAQFKARLNALEWPPPAVDSQAQ